MIVLEWILAALALAGLGVFLWIIVSFVPEPELIGIVAVCVGFAAFDFLRELTLKSRGPK